MDAKQFEVILNGIFSKRAVLFLGSGFSRASKSVSGEYLPSTDDLSTALMHVGKLDIPSKLPMLTDIADYIFGIDELRQEAVSLLRRRFQVDSISSWQSELVTQLPWRRIYTTNYDNIVELAFAKKRRDIQILSALADFERPQPDKSTCIHLNGLTALITANNIDNTIRLSGKSYASTDLIHGKWVDYFALDLNHCDVAVFIGFSVGDLDIGRLVVGANLQKKAFFFNGENPSQIERAKLSIYGSVIPWDAAQTTAKLVSSAVGIAKPTLNKHNLHAFEFIHSTEIPLAPTGDTKRDLLIYGTLPAQFASWDCSAHAGDSFTIPRSMEKDVLDSIQSGADVFVTGGLGSGKTIVAHRVAMQCSNLGMDVFWLSDIAGSWSDDIQVICSGSKSTLVVLDGAADSLKLIQAICLNRQRNLKLMLVERSVRQVNKLNDAFVDANMKDRNVHYYEADKLTVVELERVNDLLSDLGLWGRTAKLPLYERIKFLEKDCASELSYILLHIVRSEDIRNRVKAALETDQLDRSERAVICVACALAIIGYRVPLSELGRLCGTSQVNGLIQKDTEFRRKLFTHRGGELNIQSTIFARFFLTDLMPPATVLDAVSQAIKAAIRLSVKLSIEEPDRSFDQDERLTRKANTFPAPLYVFRHLQQFVNLQGNEILIASFYEQIKAGTKLSEDPLYWLQYAISCMFSKNKADSQRFIDMAYGQAALTGFNTFQIDNQYARLLLDVATETGNTEEGFEAFTLAHSILLKQISSFTKGHYPYRVAITYYDYFIHHKHALTPIQIEVIKNAAKSVVFRSEHADVPTDKKHWLGKCRRALEKIH